MKTLLLITIVTTLSVLHGFNSDQQSITGRVTDETGQPVIFCTVSLYKDGILKMGTETDFDGKYTFSKIDTGTYDIEVTYVGYAPKRQDGIVVGTGKHVRHDFVMTAGVVLDAMEIVAYKIPLVEQNISTVRVQPPPPPPVIEEVEYLQIGGSRNEATNYYIDGVRRTHGQAKGLPPGFEDHSRENYGLIQDNKFLESEGNPLSTFSIDVDRAAYSNVRRFIETGQTPPADAVRIEEMINYFDYTYPQPKEEPFSINTEMHACPWNPKHKLLQIGLQGKTLNTEHLPATNLVFLIDVSGSMATANKLPLVISSFKVLVEQLRPQDRIAIVVYAGSSGLVLPSTSGSEKRKIIEALERLQAGGSTAGAAGITLAYQTARENFIKNGNNRVVLATDGDFNVGVSSDGELVRIIEKERESGIFLTVLGFGIGNYQDHKMQQLADHGNGNHAYIDGINEAKKVLVSEFSGTLYTIAKDVKIQVEFNPHYVKSYRLIGYENRMLAAEDFNDDKKDAGEIGAGHTVTALYEIIPVGVKDAYAGSFDPLKYQKTKAVSRASSSDEWLNIKFRYKDPDGDDSRLLEQAVSASSSGEVTDNFGWSAAVASFGMILRDSEFKGESSLELVRSLGSRSIGADKNGYRAEFLRLVEAMDLLASKD